MVKGGKGEETPIAKEMPQRPQDAPQDPTGSEERRSRSQAFWGWLGLGKGGEKTGLDLLQVLAAVSIPVVAVIIGANFTSSQSESQRAAEEQRAQTQQEIEEQRAQDEALQAYLQEMGGLLLDKELLDSGEDDAVRTLARARTLTILGRVDALRKRSVVQFLYESELIGEEAPIVDLKGADLSEADLSDLSLSRVDLSGADLSGADLSDARLYLADLYDADLSGANLSDGGDANVPSTQVDENAGASLGGAKIQSADLSDADLSDAYLGDADLTNADLSGAKLIRANLLHTNLNVVDLTDADLSDAKYLAIEGQLNRARELKGATMPDGSKHE